MEFFNMLWEILKLFLNALFPVLVKALKDCLSKRKPSKKKPKSKNEVKRTTRKRFRSGSSRK